jgi:hypothetical protein
MSVTEPPQLCLHDHEQASGAGAVLPLRVRRLHGCAVGRATAPGPAQRWVPDVGASWQYQLQGRVDVTIDAQIYIVDLFDVDAALVDELRGAGRNVIC